MTDRKTALEDFNGFIDMVTGPYGPPGYGLPDFLRKSTVETIRSALTDDPERVEKLIEAARAVIARWDTPAWKDAPATAVFINELHAALKAYGEKNV